MTWGMKKEIIYRTTLNIVTNKKEYAYDGIREENILEFLEHVLGKDRLYLYGENDLKRAKFLFGCHGWELIVKE